MSPSPSPSARWPTCWPDDLRYAIRESPRAKHVRLQVSAAQGLEIVVPVGYDRRQLPDILAQKRHWIERATARMAEKHAHLHAPAAAKLPTEVCLPAIAETWRVECLPLPTKPPSLVTRPGRVLILSGRTDNLNACDRLLLAWTMGKARLHLLPWLARLSAELQLPYTRASVRSQRTRWGSCSNRGAISLNAKLLFLAPDLVRYVAIHELCHTVHLNHSPSFWGLVAQHEPAYRTLDRQLDHAWRDIPPWVERMFAGDR